MRLPPRRRPPARLRASLLAGAAFASLSTTAFAQAADDYDYGDVEVQELVVSGSRPAGSVIGDITPELTLSPQEIRAYGAASVTELLEALSPQIGSGQGGGRPVILINGGRISGFSEIRDLPTEAIARVEILPEELSLKYGYPAEQKVVNMVLRPRFRATLVEGTVRTPTQAGGGETLGAHGARLDILQGRRLTVDGKANWTGGIEESDRDITGGEGAFRSLQAKSNDVSLNAAYARPLDNGVSMSVNGLFEASDSESRQGLSPFGPEALLRNTERQTARLAASATGALAGWQWSTTGEIERGEVETDTDRASGGRAFQDTARTVTTSGAADLVLNRSFGELPAGQISTALTARASATELESEAVRLGAFQASDLSRTVGELRGNFDIPLTRDGEGLGEHIGRLSANLNLGVEQVSDFGALETWGYGLNWRPTSDLRLLGSFSRSGEAPTMNQLGDPVTVTTGVRVFDLTRGETAEVARTTGGLATLDAGQKDVFKLGATWQPLDDVNLRLQANYVSSRTHDAIVAFPSASTQVEAAFPDRFTRDAAGALTAIDARPVNFALQARDEVRWGLTYSRQIGSEPTADERAERRRRFEAARPAAAPATQAQAPAEAGAQRPAEDRPTREGPPDGPPAGDGPPPSGPPGGGMAMGGRGPGGPGGGFGGFGGGGPRSGVFQVGFYHTLALRDEVQIAPGLPKLDLLDGAALGSGGGSPLHQLELQTNYSKSGLGVAMNANWQSATTISGSTPEGDLEFSDLATVNLRLFADPGRQRWARDYPWLRGARATLSIDNIFDARQEVRTSDGVTPITYQPDLLDPVGRTVRLTVRKLIF
ncbi:MAG: TonB-dependent receptor [Phenylobacterium sp.]|nr:TonB-dependent receptor [Phenylobacterium sp.]